VGTSSVPDAGILVIIRFNLFGRKLAKMAATILFLRDLDSGKRHQNSAVKSTKKSQNPLFS
jgi:hypothetical protein